MHILSPVTAERFNGSHHPRSRGLPNDFLSILSSDFTGVVCHTNRKYWCPKCRICSTPVYAHVLSTSFFAALVNLSGLFWHAFTFFRIVSKRLLCQGVNFLTNNIMLDLFKEHFDRQVQYYSKCLYIV